jgi:hypothetical protein
MNHISGNNNSSVLEIGIQFGGNNNYSITSKKRTFRAFFGSHRAAAACWILLMEQYPNIMLLKKHMLIALYYLKANPTNKVAASFLKCHIQTYTSLRDYYVELICHLPVVSLLNYI